MKTTTLPPDDREKSIEQVMFASHTTNLWVPLYHYWKMGHSFCDLSIHEWIIEGVPQEFQCPPDNIEVMYNMHDFHEFRQKMITHLYKEYVEDWGSEDDED